MAIPYKIVFAGPVGCGKTTAIQTLSDIQVVSTEAAASDEVRRLKKSTTVAMDYGVLKMPDGDQVRLYGAPGQRRFDFMWDILMKDAMGLVLLINAAASDPVSDLRFYLGEFRPLITGSAVVVGLTHTDICRCDMRQAFADEMAHRGVPPCVMEVDGRERADVAMLVRALLFSIDPFAGASLAQAAR